MSDDLDTRARSAAEGLRRAVADVPVPEVGQAPPPRRATVALAVAAVAVVLAVVGALVLVGDDGTDVSTGPVAPMTGVPPLVLDPVPDGLEVTGVVELPLVPALAGGSRTVTAFGDPDADDPFGAGGASITVVVDGSGNEVTDVVAKGGEYVDVPGASAALGPDPLHDGRRVVVLDLGDTGVLDGNLVVVDSDVLDDDELVAVASEVVDAGGAAPGALPGGLVPVGSVTLTGYLPMQVPLLPAAPGQVVGYQGPDPGDGVTVAVAAGDGTTVRALRWVLGADRSVPVRSTSGWVASGVDGGATVVWPEGPDAVGVLATSLPEADALGLVEALRPATDEEWAALPRSSVAEGRAVAPPDAQAAVPSYGDGPTSWVVYLDADGALCLEVLEVGSSSSSCNGSPSGDLVADAYQLADGSWVVYGLTTSDPATSQVVLRGDAYGASLAVVPRSGALFAAQVDVDRLPDVVAVEDVATGEDLATSPVGARGSPIDPTTGEPTTTVPGG